MLKSSLLLFAAVLLVVVCLPLRGRTPQQGTPAPAVEQQPAVTPAPPVQAKNPVKPTAESQAKAKGLYQIDCALCHGDNGNGQTDLAKSMELTMEDWSNPSTLANKTDADLFAVIRNGKGKMPPEDAARAKDSDVWNLIIYIRKFASNQPAPAAPVAAPASPATPNQ
ncbi:MAG: cytochrome c [Terracidiphilus sp.]|jgi:mono/diheme cytochrome c family protein